MADAFVVVDPSLETPPYQQILEQIRALIERGELAPGTVLPTVRQLAGDLAVAPNTVARAYADLQAENWIAADGRRGTRVAERVPSADKRVRGRALHDAVLRFVSSLTHRGYTEGEIADELRRALQLP
ncbi:MAG TPA: GntR family transcriptional regulator [Candidatus Elarobacter sp.]